MVVKADLRSKFLGIRDQGARPTCLAFAVSDTHAALRPEKQELSCEYIYHHAVNSSHGDPRRGVDFDSILRSLRTNGQPIESRWAYLGTVPPDISMWKPPIGITPLYRRDSVRQAKDLDDILDRIDRDTPVIIGMTISRAFYQPGNEGIISANEPSDLSLRHAVVGLGHGLNGQDRLVLVRNSWGSAWGLNGHAWIAEHYLNPRLIAYAELSHDLTI